jgi:hypothetical protein
MGNLAHITTVEFSLNLTSIGLKELSKLLIDEPSTSLSATFKAARSSRLFQESKIF